MRPESPYLVELSQAVLKMQETNRLLILKKQMVEREARRRTL